ncbi:DUF4920 domain-containing protein [Mucilaginibacter aquaedulcis]|uniref:DUF4920 domain-containing protein n=1 Tax=Mucilaginibacter aquaedulcis TaxID=1187081 RepID=UPI0025B37267|nr:DUF4920 domain-containing protein [Mucilaginibacter aquaedulcis]MDN3550380.1 DUF4920 domain-containing protein [Mucilaginibacter aquaedulcis]
MKLGLYLVVLFVSTTAFAQKHTPLPHGMVYGSKPDTTAMMNADKVEDFMGKKTRISTTIKGKVLRVKNEKGGWFEMDAGNGRVIAAHFRDYNVTLPVAMAGHIVIIEGVAAKQFIADDLQHMAGDTVSGKKQHKIKTDARRKVSFEVKGLFVDK